MHPPRQGPRPLQVHLLAQAGTLLSSLAALPNLRNGSLNLKSGPSRNLPADQQQALLSVLKSLSPQAWGDFAQAVAQEAIARHRRFVGGIIAYRKHPVRRKAPSYPVVWQQGTTRLLDCRAEGSDGPPVLIVPSLINRSYILDFTPRTSVIRGLSRRQVSPFMVDWGEPGEEESQFTISDYIVQRLVPALEAVSRLTGGKIAVLGYCMGGMLALALALRQSAQISGLVLLATPWDFHQGFEVQRVLLEPLFEPLAKIIQAQGLLPVDILQTLFASFDPQLTSRKFAQFKEMPRRSGAAKEFVLVEDWVNDGVPLVQNVALECLENWYLKNTPAQGHWVVDGVAVCPEKLLCPSLVIVPKKDRIVTPASALALAQCLPQTDLRQVDGGHVGMLLSRQVGSSVHAPIAHAIKKWAGIFKGKE